MANKYKHVDSWTREQVAQFKYDVRYGRPAGVDAAAMAAAAALPVIRIIAEGDSWFDYPIGIDLIDWLRRRSHRFDIVENFAAAGDTLENMIYGTKIRRDFSPETPSICKVLKLIEEERPRVFLFSGGGNDVAGDEFGSFLNHVESGVPDLRAGYVDYMVDVVFRKYYEDLIAKVAMRSPNTTIVTHGYGRTAPTGKGVDLLFWTFVGPWLKPALAQKRIFNEVRQREIVFHMIDRFNEMLLRVSQANPTRFVYVDLRPHIDPDEDWANELHLTDGSYATCADVIAQRIRALP